jgi:hypothetical protein
VGAKNSVRGLSSSRSSGARQLEAERASGLFGAPLMLWFTRARIPLPARTRATAVQPTRRRRGTRSCSLPPDSSGAQLAMGRACRQNRTSRGPHRRPTLLRRRDLRPELQKSRQSQAGHPTVRRSSSTSSPSRLAGTSTPSTRTEADSARLRTEATPKPRAGAPTRWPDRQRRRAHRPRHHDESGRRGRRP